MYSVSFRNDLGLEIFEREFNTLKEVLRYILENEDFIEVNICQTGETE